LTTTREAITVRHILLELGTEIFQQRRQRLEGQPPFFQERLLLIAAQAKAKKTVTIFQTDRLAQTGAAEVDMFSWTWDGFGHWFSFKFGLKNS
jgi:hypothetical protein